MFLFSAISSIAILNTDVYAAAITSTGLLAMPDEKNKMGSG